MNNQSVIALDPTKIRDISPLALDESGRLKLLPAEFWAGTTVHERAMLGVTRGLYGFPTVELIAWLKEVIADRLAIEIGAGNGILAQGLGIQATDNLMQLEPEVAQHYATLRQTTVPYGANVEKLDALSAISKYKPQVVISQWVTHKYDPNRHEAGGNQFGVNEEAVINSCETYISIGNLKTHAGKSIWSLPHKLLKPKFLYSRAFNGARDYIAIFGKY